MRSSEKVFGERRADHLLERVLPISTKALTDVQILFDKQYRLVRDPLQPGKRRCVEARSMLRGLLAMEGHVSDDARVSERDVNRVEKGVRDGKQLAQVSPRLTGVAASFAGEGPRVKVHFTKRDGAQSSTSGPMTPAKPRPSRRSTFNASTT